MSNPEELHACGKPDCGRLVSPASVFCCLPCAQASEGGYELAAHSAGCDQRAAGRGAGLAFAPCPRHAIYRGEERPALERAQCPDCRFPGLGDSWAMRGEPEHRPPCPLCGTPVTLGDHRIIEDGAALLVVADPPGTFWPHLRDLHPAEFAEAVSHRERLNDTLGAQMGAMPRNVDGTLLPPGRRVGALGVAGE